MAMPFVLSEGVKTEGGRWSKVNSFIYIDRSTVKKNEYGASEGWFKIYNSPENKLYSVTNKNVHYELIKYHVDCTDPAIFTAHYKTYDKNNNLLYEEINAQMVGCSCPCVTYDDIYLRELCK